LCCCSCHRIIKLDKYKHHKEKGYNVRKVSRLIEAADKRNDGSIELTNKYKEVPDLNRKVPDDRILSAAPCFMEEGKQVGVLSNDRLVRLKAKGLGIVASTSPDEITSLLAKKATRGETAAGSDISLASDKDFSARIGSAQMKTMRDDPPPRLHNWDGAPTTFEHKKQIFRSFPELTERVGQDGRVSYNFLGSKRRKKQIARELTHTGNGYIYGAYLPEYKSRVDPRGWISIKNCSEKELRELIRKVINSFK